MTLASREFPATRPRAFVHTPSTVNGGLDISGGEADLGEFGFRDAAESAEPSWFARDDALSMSREHREKIKLADAAGWHFRFHDYEGTYDARTEAARTPHPGCQ